MESAKGSQIFIGALVRNLVDKAVSGGGRGRRMMMLGVWVRQHKEQGRKCRGMGVGIEGIEEVLLFRKPQGRPAAQGKAFWIKE